MTTVLVEVPLSNGWTEVPFRAIANKVSEPGYGHLEPLSVYLDAGVIPRSSREDNHNQLGENIEKYQRVLPNDLVFNKLRTWQGGFGISDYEGIVSPAYIIARPIPGAIDPRFLGYLLKSAPYLAELKRLSKWMPPSQFDISWDSIRDLRLRIPKIEEQRRIAGYLDIHVLRIEMIIEKIGKLLSLEQSLLRDSRVAFLTDVQASLDWSPTRVGWSCRIRFGEPFDSDRFMSEGTLPLVRMGDLGAEEFTIYVDPASAPRNCRIENGDLLVGMSGQFQVEIWNRGPAALNQRLVALNSEVSQIVLATIIKPQLDEINELLPRTTLRNLSADQVRCLKFYLPKSTLVMLEAESEIRKFENRYQKALSTLTVFSEKMQEFKTSLVTSAVTGILNISTGRSVA